MTLIGTENCLREGPEQLDSQLPLAVRAGGDCGGSLAHSEPYDGKDSLLILFGTVTGNAETIAHGVAETARQRGFAARVQDMAHYKADLLAREKCVLIVTSTYGNGEPPTDATPFWQEIICSGGLDLRGLSFSVLALGNSTYDHFCQCGKDFDAALEQLGGTRLFPRVDCDMDFTVPVNLWIDGVLGALAQEYLASAA